MTNQEEIDEDSSERSGDWEHGFFEPLSDQWSASLQLAGRAPFR